VLPADPRTIGAILVFLTLDASELTNDSPDKALGRLFKRGADFESLRGPVTRDRGPRSKTSDFLPECVFG